MCFERTNEKVEPFSIGYRVMKKSKNRYIPTYDHYSLDKKWPYPPIVVNRWVDERPYRCMSRNHEGIDDLFNDKDRGVGWHVVSTKIQAQCYYKLLRHVHVGGIVIVRVECYGLESPYGLGFVDDKPAGRFQFMKILGEVK